MPSDDDERTDPETAAENAIHRESIRRDPLTAIVTARQILRTVAEADATDRDAAGFIDPAIDQLAEAAEHQRGADVREAEGVAADGD